GGIGSTSGRRRGTRSTKSGNHYGTKRTMQANIEKIVAPTAPFPPQLSRLTFGEFARARLRVELEVECAVCGHVRRLDPDDEALRHQTIASRSHRCTVILGNRELCRGSGFARIRRRL